MLNIDICAQTHTKFVIVVIIVNFFLSKEKDMLNSKCSDYF